MFEEGSSTRPHLLWNEIGQLCLDFANDYRLLWTQQPTGWEVQIAAHHLALARKLKRIELQLEKAHPVHALLVSQLRILAEALTVNRNAPVLLLGHFCSFNDAAFRRVST